MSTTDLKRAPDSPPSASAPSIKRTMSSNPAPAVSPSDLLVQKLSPSASLPTRGSALAAGYDIYASKATTIPAGGRTVVATDIAIAIPEGTYARVAPRSGLAVKHGIQTGAGVVDADYRGMVGVLLFNHGSEDFQVNQGDRIAQLVLERIVTPKVQEVASLSETVRGGGGFGSTGGFGGAAAEVKHQQQTTSRPTEQHAQGYASVFD